MAPDIVTVTQVPDSSSDGFAVFDVNLFGDDKPKQQPARSAVPAYQYPVRGRPIVDTTYLKPAAPEKPLGFLGTAVKYVNFTHFVDTIGLASVGITWLVARVFLFGDPDPTLKALNPDVTMPGSLPASVSNAAVSILTGKPISDPGAWSLDLDRRPPQWVWQAIILLSIVVFVIVLGLHFAKLFVYGWRQLWFEFGIPFVGHCFVLIGGTLYLYVIAARFCSDANAFPYENALGPMASFPLSLTGLKSQDDATKGIFWVAGPIQILGTLLTYYKWFTEPKGIGAMNVTWLLPFAADILGAGAFALAGPNYNLIAWLFFSFGIFNWTIIMTLLCYKHFFVGNPLGPLPAAYVLLAVPALACVSWNILTAPGLPWMAEFHVATASMTSPVYKNPWQSGIIGLFNWNAGGQIFYWITMTIYVFILVLELRNPFWKRPFNRLYYIYMFPSNCVAITTICYHGWVNTYITKILSFILLIFITIQSAAIFVFSAIHFFKGEGIFFDLGPAITQPAATLVAVEHAAMKTCSADLAQRLSSGMADLRDVRGRVEDLYVLMNETAKHQDIVYGPIAASLSPEAAAKAAANREADLTLVASARSALDGALSNTSESRRRELLGSASQYLSALARDIDAHVSAEAGSTLALANTIGNNALAADLLRRAWGLTAATEWRRVMVQIGSLPAGEAGAFFGFFQRSLPEYTPLVGTWLYEGLPEAQFEALAGGCPALRPPSTPGFTPYWS
eukprot:tig00020675_g12592.t1